MPWLGARIGLERPAPPLKDEMTLKSSDPIPLYYESLHGRNPRH